MQLIGAAQFRQATLHCNFLLLSPFYSFAQSTQISVGSQQRLLQAGRTKQIANTRMASCDCTKRVNTLPIPRHGLRQYPI